MRIRTPEGLMPAHVIFICLIMNVAIAAFMVLAGLTQIGGGSRAALVICFLVAAVCAYTAYTINKIRLYLKSEAALERELRLAKLRASIAEANDDGAELDIR